MLYLANPCGGDLIVNAMMAGLIGYMDSPAQGNRRPDSVPWAADNGCFSDRWDQGKWWSFLVRNAPNTSSCLFAVAPDVVADAAATIERSAPWMPRIRALGYPVALVAQDGLEDIPVPWDAFDVLFIGGSTSWKLGADARHLVGVAKGLGKSVHMGRVNSERRYSYALNIGCDSVDGTYLTFGPTQNLPNVLAWSRLANQGRLFDAGALT